MNAGPYLNFFNYRTNGTANLTPNTNVQNIPVCDNNVSGTKTGFPEDNIDTAKLPLNKLLRDVPEFAPLLSEIKDAYYQYQIDEQKKFGSYFKNILEWDVSDLQGLVKFIKEKWDNENVQSAYGSLLFNVRAALLNYQAACQPKESQAILDGETFVSQQSLFVASGLPKDSEAKDFISLGEEKASVWRDGKLTALKENIVKAYAESGKKWAGNNWTEEDLVNFYQWVIDNQKDAGVKKSFSPLLADCKTALAAHLGLKDAAALSDKDFIARANKQATAMAKPVWQNPVTAELKSQLVKAYKDYGKKWEGDDWTLSDLANFYRWVADNKNTRAVNKNFAHLLPQVKKTVISILGITYSPAVAHDDKATKFFAETVFPEVMRAAKENRIPASLVGSNEAVKAVLGGKESLTSDEVKAIWQLWGALKRLEAVQEAKAQSAGNAAPDALAVLKFEDKSKRNANLTLAEIRGVLFALVENDPKKNPDTEMELTEQQTDKLYDVYANNEPARNWLETVWNNLPSQLQKKLAADARTNSLDFFLTGDRGNKAAGERIAKLQSEKSTLDGQLYALGIEIKQLREYSGPNVDENRKREIIAKKTEEEESLAGKVKEKENELKKAEDQFIASLGTKWAEAMNKQRLSFIWKQIDAAVSLQNKSLGRNIFQLNQIYFDEAMVTSSQKTIAALADESVNEKKDLLYAQYLAYMQTRDKGDTNPAPDRAKYETFAKAVLGTTFISAALPTLYLARRKEGTKKEDKVYTYEPLNLNKPIGRMIGSILKLADPKGEIKSPEMVFAGVLGGRLDRDSWLQLFPNKERSKSVQDKMARQNIEWKSFGDNAEDLTNLQLSMAQAYPDNKDVADPKNFDFIGQVIGGRSKLIVRVKTDSGVIKSLDDNNLEVSRLENGRKVKLTEGEKTIFILMTQKFNAGQNVAEKGALAKFKQFLTAYTQTFGNFSPELENQAIMIAANVVKNADLAKSLGKQLSNPEFESRLVSFLSQALKAYAADPGIDTPGDKFARIVESVYQANIKQIVNKFSAEKAFFAGNKKDGDKTENPLMNELLANLNQLRMFTKQLGKELVKSPYMASSAVAAENGLEIGSRVIEYLKGDLSVLKTAKEAGMTKTKLYVIDTFVLEGIGKGLALDVNNNIMSSSEDGSLVSRAVGFVKAGDSSVNSKTAEWALNLLTDRVVTDPKKFDSAYSWLWWEPASVVLLSLYKNIPGLPDVFSFDPATGNMTVRNRITAGDLLALADSMKAGKPDQLDLDKAKSLASCAAIMQKHGVSFGNEIFVGDTGRDEDVKIGNSGKLPADDFNKLKEAVLYLRKWHDKTSRLAQAVAGTQYQAMLQGQMKQKVDTSFWSWAADSAMHIPTAMLSRNLQTLDSDKTLALKESLFSDIFAKLRSAETKDFQTSSVFGGAYSCTRSFFEGMEGATYWDAETISRFFNSFKGLFQHSVFNTLVMAEKVEDMGDEKKTVEGFIARLRGGQIRSAREGKIELAIDPNNDSPEDQKAKLVIQNALSRWTPGMKPVRDGIVGNLAMGAEEFLMGTLVGSALDDTSPKYNYPMRFKAFLSKSSFRYSGNFSLLDNEITTEQINFAGVKFEAFVEKLKKDTSLEKEMLVILKLDNISKLEEMAKALKEYKGGSITGLGYTDNSSADPAKKAMVFFIRKIIPNYGLIAAGEGDSVFVNMPLMLAAEANKWQVSDIKFGAPSGPSPANSPISVADRHGKGIKGFASELVDMKSDKFVVGQIGNSMVKGINFNLMMHPTIQLGLQLGFAIKLVRAIEAEGLLANGELSEGTKRVAKDWATQLLNFIAFQYNPLALASSGINNLIKGDLAGGSVDLVFAYKAAQSVGRLFLKLLKLAKHSPEFAKLKLEKGFIGKAGKIMAGEVNEQIKLLTEKALFEADAAPQAKWQVRQWRRMLSTAKNAFIEPFTTLSAHLDLSFGEQHVFWKNMTYLAQNPDAIISMDVKFGTATKSVKVRAGDLFEIYRATLAPNVAARVVSGSTSFVPFGGRLAQALTAPLGRTARQILPNLSNLNQGTLTPEEVNEFFGRVSGEAGAIAEGKIKTTAGGRTKRAVQWFVHDLTLQSQINRLKMQSLQNMRSTREALLGNKLPDTDVPVADSMIEESTPTPEPTTPVELREALATAEKAINNPATTQKLIEFLKTPEGHNFLKTNEGVAWLENLNKLGTTSDLKVSGAGLVVGLALALGMDKFFEVIGLENKKARFALSLGIFQAASVTTNLAAVKVLKPDVARALMIVKSVVPQSLMGKAVSGAAKVLGGSSLVTGFGEMAFAALAYEGLLNTFNVNNSVLRSQAAHIIVSAVTPAAVKWGAKTLASQLGTKIVPKLGGALTGIGLANFIFDTLPNIFTADYVLSVNKRTFEIVESERARSDSALVWTSGAVVSLFHGIAGSKMEQRTSETFPEIRRSVVEGDIKLAQEERAKLTQELRDFVTGGGNIKLLTEEQSWGKIAGSVSEEAVIKFAAEYIRKNQGAEFGGQQHVAAIMKAFPKLSMKNVFDVFIKAMAIGWQNRLKALQAIEPGKVIPELTFNNDIKAWVNSNGVVKKGQADSFKHGFIGL